MASSSERPGGDAGPGRASVRTEPVGPEVRRAAVRRSAAAAVAVALLVVGGVVGVALLADGDDGGADVAALPTPSDTVEQGGPDSSALPDDPTPAPPVPQPQTLQVGSCTYEVEGEPVRPVEPPTEADLPASGTLLWTLETDQGPIVVTLDAAGAPCTTAVLTSLSAQGYYDDTPCFRLTDASGGIFVLQCGDPTGSGTGTPGYRYAEENLPGAPGYPAGTVAMAKTAAPDSTGAQFFLVYADTPLPPEYTVVGQITEGMDVLDRVAAAGIDPAAPPAPALPLQIEQSTVTPAG